MGKKFFAIYLLIALVVWPFHKHFGDHFDRGYAYNLGESMVWPVLLFSSKPTIDGSSDTTIGLSMIRMAKNLDSGERIAMLDALGMIKFYYLVKNDHNVTHSLLDIAEQEGTGAVSRRIQASPQRDKILAEYRDAIDGETFHGLYAMASDLREDTADALKKNREIAAISAPVRLPAVSQQPVTPPIPSATPTRQATAGVAGANASVVSASVTTSSEASGNGSGEHPDRDEQAQAQAAVSVPASPLQAQASGSGSAAAVRVLADDRAATRRGDADVVSTGDFSHEVRLDGQKVFRSNGMALAFKAAYAIGDDDVLLLEDDSGGTACPAQYVFITVPAHGLATATREFGTCSDLPTMTRDGMHIIVRMSGNDGAMHVYTYAGGSLQG